MLDLSAILDSYSEERGFPWTSPVEEHAADERDANRLKRAGRRSRHGLRKQVVEPVFGQMKQARGFRQFLLRGLDLVRGEAITQPLASVKSSFKSAT